jgi:hypothetical protein
MMRERRRLSPVRGTVPCVRRFRAPLAKLAAPLLPAVACFIAMAMLAAPARAQVRFEMPDPAVDLQRYTTVDDCLAATGRVRDSVLGQATAWRDSVLATPTNAREPLAAPVLEIARRCSARITAAAVPRAEFAATLQLFLLAGRDADARTLVERRLAAVKASAIRERAAVLDTAVEAFLGAEVVNDPFLDPVLGARPARLEVADSLLELFDRTLARLPGDSLRVESIGAHARFMIAARDAGDTARAIVAARHLVTLAHAGKLEPTSVYGRSIVESARTALELIAWPELLDSLRHGTPTYVARLRSDWARASGESGESYGRFQPAGSIAPPIEADFWFGRGDDAAPRPTHGKVALVIFLDQRRCAAQQCFVVYAALHRLAAKYPELEITLVARTHGYLSQAAPPPPEEEAELLRRHWLDERLLPGALAVHNTSYYLLPEPDGRRIDRGDPNDERYQFGRTGANRAPFERAVLVDRNGVVVDESLLRDSAAELRLYQLIDAVLAQGSASS